MVSSRLTGEIDNRWFELSHAWRLERVENEVQEVRASAESLARAKSDGRQLSLLNVFDGAPKTALASVATRRPSLTALRACSVGSLASRLISRFQASCAAVLAARAAWRSSRAACCAASRSGSTRLPRLALFVELLDGHAGPSESSEVRDRRVLGGSLRSSPVHASWRHGITTDCHPDRSEGSPRVYGVSICTGGAGLSTEGVESWRLGPAAGRIYDLASPTRGAGRSAAISVAV